VFARYLVMTLLAGQTLDQVPAWLDSFAATGWTTYDTQAARISVDGIGMARDSIVLMLPMIAGLPDAFVDLALAGLLAATLVAASAQVQALATTIGEDILLAWRDEWGAEAFRLVLLRSLGLTVAGLGCWMALSVRADPFALYLWGLAILGPSLLAPIVMSVWWKRINTWGALASVATGLGLSGSALLLDLSGGLGASGPATGLTVAALSLPVAVAAAVAVSLITPRPEKRMLEVVRDMRVPGGETLFERELRLQKASRKRPV
jgi:cation/acetate symporter